MVFHFGLHTASPKFDMQHHRDQRRWCYLDLARTIGNACSCKEVLTKTGIPLRLCFGVYSYRISERKRPVSGSELHIAVRRILERHRLGTRERKGGLFVLRSKLERLQGYKGTTRQPP